MIFLFNPKNNLKRSNKMHLSFFFYKTFRKRIHGGVIKVFDYL